VLALTLGALATRSCESTGEHHRYHNRDHFDHNRYYREDQYDRNNYRSERPCGWQKSSEVRPFFLKKTTESFLARPEQGSGKARSWCWSLTGFELALKDEGGEGELLFWQAELGAEKDPTDFGLADAAEFLEGQGASAAGGRQDRQRVERCDPRRLGRGHPD
jgi:hypothetical protein